MLDGDSARARPLSIPQLFVRQHNGLCSRNDCRSEREGGAQAYGASLSRVLVAFSALSPPHRPPCLDVRSCALCAAANS